MSITTLNLVQKPNSPISKTQRRYKVGYVPNFGDTSTPALNISGKWLREAGFDTGTRVSAEISEGCIVLRVDKS